MTPELAENIFNRGIGAAVILLIAALIMGACSVGAIDAGHEWPGRIGIVIAAIVAIAGVACGLGAVFAGFAVPA